MKLMTVILTTVLVSMGVQAANSPGSLAFRAISGAGNAFSTGNYRSGCQALGAFKAYKSLANSSNTDQWTLRNLGYGAAEEAVLVDFCSGPTSKVTKDQAAAAARSIDSNFGLE